MATPRDSRCPEAPPPVLGAEAKPKPRTLFTTVHVFDGIHEERIENANVLVEGDLIKQVSTTKITADGDRRRREHAAARSAHRLRE